MDEGEVGTSIGERLKNADDVDASVGRQLARLFALQYLIFFLCDPVFFADVGLDLMGEARSGGRLA